MSNFISIRNLHLYPLQADTASELKYGEGIKIPGLVKVSVNPNMSEGTYWADGIAYETVKKLGEVGLSIQAAAMDLKTQAAICGHTYNEEAGTLICNADDVPPAFGMKYERVKADGTSRFIAINKVVFKLQNDEGQTASDSIEFQDTGDLEATATPTINNGEWRAMIEKNDNNAEMIAKFFTAFVIADEALRK